MVAGVGLLISIGLAFVGQSISSFTSAGGWFTFAGRLTGLSGTYLLIIMVLLVTRLPWLEETVGQVRLVRWHRTVGGWPIALIALHVVFITLGYAEASHVGFLSQFWTFIKHYPDMLTATVAFALLVLAGVTSIPAVRRMMKYQTWWAVHLYLYLALVLSFAHEIKTGVMFIGHPLTLDFWIAVSAGALGAVLAVRMVRPLARNLRRAGAYLPFAAALEAALSAALAEDAAHLAAVRHFIDLHRARRAAARPDSRYQGDLRIGRVGRPAGAATHGRQIGQLAGLRAARRRKRKVSAVVSERRGELHWGQAIACGAYGPQRNL